MKRKSFTPLREQTINMEPRPVTTDQIDGVMNSSEALDVKMQKLNDLRQQHDDWASRQPETDGRPLLRYIDEAVKRLLQDGDLDKVSEGETS
jgi:ABC-type amino acid transport substrate-binding protein